MQLSDTAHGAAGLFPMGTQAAWKPTAQHRDRTRLHLASLGDIQILDLEYDSCGMREVETPCVRPS